MERLKLKISDAKKALKSFEEILAEPFSVIVRDASIQRFEYTFEFVWKTLKEYLDEKEGIRVSSPKGVFREALSVGLLDVEQCRSALMMTDDRNETSHTYKQEVAESLFKKLPANYSSLQALFDKISC